METDEPPLSSRKRRLDNTPQRTLPASTPRASIPPSASFQSSGNRLVSQEQRAFLNLLRSLLVSPAAPILSTTLPIQPVAILNRMHRLLAAYHRNTSVQSDILQSLSAILPVLALNKRALVVRFARRAWVNLVSMWNMKNVSAREHLVTILKLLLPYYIIEHRPELPTPSMVADGIKKLSRALEQSDNGRRSAEGLSFDALRLQIEPPRDSGQPGLAFVAGTFQHGWQFDEKQALAWAVLELQADCLAKVRYMSSAVKSTTQSLSATVVLPV